ncbi:MAG TPA: DUF3108 domain-containing protein [Opitutales bacterium]|nr:DUF3108 domain-containing protein [Opitutales bacterium]
MKRRWASMIMMRFLLKCLAVTFVTIFLTGPLLAESEATPIPLDELPFKVGERLTYSLRWGVIRAGIGVLEVHPVTETDGEEVYHFSLSVRTTSLVDRFYKVRDRIDGFVRTDFSGSKLYLVKKDAGKNLRDVEVIYNSEEGFAQYSNFGEEREPVEILPGTLDPLSVLFAVRSIPLKNGENVELPISDGKRVSMGVARVRGTKRITVPDGNYRTILVEPDMRDVGGVFEKSGDSPMEVYFSNDERQLPVRIASEVVVGKFTADLVSVEQVPEKDLKKFEHPRVD